MILKRCSACLFFFFSFFPFFPSGRANVQSDTFNILEEIDAGISSMLHYFLLFFLLFGVVSLVESSRIALLPGTPSHRLPQKKTTKDTSELKL